jgi:hypothetical protein
MKLSQFLSRKIIASAAGIACGLHSALALADYVSTANSIAFGYAMQLSSACSTELDPYEYYPCVYGYWMGKASEANAWYLWQEQWLANNGCNSIQSQMGQPNQLCQDHGNDGYVASLVSSICVQYASS